MPATESLLPLALPVSLDGRDGTNRARDTNCQVDADTDIKAVRFWLAEYTLSPYTLRNYRREAIRLIVWSSRALGKPISSLTREDFQLYEKFLAAPDVDWTNPAPPRRGGARRLFDSPLSTQSRQQALIILSSMLNYLVSVGYLATNPLAAGPERTGSTSRGRRIKHDIDSTLWKFVLDSIESWPQSTLRERQRYERSRWAMRLLYQSALRVSEVANLKSCDFTQRRGRWSLRVKCKGGIDAEVSVSDVLMADFARYRSFHGLSRLPLAYDTAPAVLSICGDTTRQLAPATLYLIAREVFHRAGTMLESVDPDGAKTLSRATTHWLRHSAISHQSSSSSNSRLARGEATGCAVRFAARSNEAARVPVSQDEEQRSTARRTTRITCSARSE
jgi:integrase